MNSIIRRRGDGNGAAIGTGSATGEHECVKIAQLTSAIEEMRRLDLRSTSLLMALSDQMLTAPPIVVGLGHEQPVPIFQQLAGDGSRRTIPNVIPMERGSRHRCRPPLAPQLDTMSFRPAALRGDAQGDVDG